MARPNRGVRLETNARGVYEIRWSEGGRSKRRSTGTADAAEAADIFKEWKLDLKRERDAAEASTVRGLLDAYFKERVYPRVAGIETADFARSFLLHHFADMHPADIRPADARDYARLRMEGRLVVGKDDAGQPRLCRPVQGSTVRRELGVLVAALNHATRERRLAPADLPSIPLPEANPPRERWCTESEVRHLLATAARTPAPAGRLPRVYRFAMLAYYTAARKRAIETLKWAQVDWDSGEHGAIDYEAPGARRTKKRRAKVPMTAALRAMMERAFAERESAYVLDHAGSIRRAFETATRTADLDDVTPHVMRHTAATHMLRRGVALWQVAGVLGDTEATVRRVYGKHVPEALAEAVGALL